MRLILVCILLGLACGCWSEGAAWYTSIKPFSQKADILAIAGPPDRQEGGRNIYDLAQGYLRLKYDGSLLEFCDHMDPGEGVFSRSYYSMRSPSKIIAGGLTAQEFVDAGLFTTIPQLNGPRVRSHGINGLCYQLDEGYVVLRPLISLMGGSGHFADKLEAVWVVAGDQVRTLYRACDHWPQLRPVTLSAEELLRREDVLNRISDRRLLRETLGKPDAVMGSGISYGLYYVKDGMLVVSNYQNPRIHSPGEDVPPP